MGKEILYIGVGTPPPAGDGVELPVGSGATEIARVGAGRTWVVVVFPGETIPAETLDVLPGAIVDGPATVGAISVPLHEISRGETRFTWATRVVRPGAIGRVTWGLDPELESEGRRVRAPRLPFALDRKLRAGIVGEAERAEAAGDDVGARERWALVGKRDDAWGAYGLLRSATALARLIGHENEVRDLLGSAVARHPSLPEAYLRLAEWWLTRGALTAALACGALADAIVDPLPSVPHLEGTGTWLVPLRMSRLIQAVNTQQAHNLLTLAAERGAPVAASEEGEDGERRRTRG